MRIAVSGSHATGKTSLVAELCTRLANVTAVDEAYYLLDEEGHVFETPPSDADYEMLIERSFVLLAEEHAGSVVFDRSPADYLAYLVAGGRRPIESEHVSATAAALSTLDLIVFVPIEHPDRVAGAEALRLRRRVDRILREMLVEGSWGFDVSIVTVEGTPEERADQVLARLKLMATNAKVV